MPGNREVTTQIPQAPGLRRDRKEPLLCPLYFCYNHKWKRKQTSCTEIIIVHLASIFLYCNVQKQAWNAKRTPGWRVPTSFSNLPAALCERRARSRSRIYSKVAVLGCFFSLQVLPDHGWRTTTAMYAVGSVRALTSSTSSRLCIFFLLWHAIFLSVPGIPTHHHSHTSVTLSHPSDKHRCFSPAVLPKACTEYCTTFFISQKLIQQVKMQYM